MTTPSASASPDAARAIFFALQQRAADAGLLLRAPPAELTTCCGRGCNGCVWESYYAAAHWWQAESLQRLEA